MYAVIEIASDVQRNEIVSFNGTSWSRASDSSSMLGVVTGEPFEQDGKRLAEVTFAGLAMARAARAIDVHGGGLAVENGGAYVGPLAGAGIISPVAFDQLPPQAGDLVLVFLR